MAKTSKKKKTVSSKPKTAARSETVVQADSSLHRPSSAPSTNAGDDLDINATADPPVDDVLSPLVDPAPLGLVDSSAPDTTLGGAIVNPSPTDSNTPRLLSSVDHVAAIPTRQSDRKDDSAGGRTSSD